MVLMLNFVIAILSSTYARYETQTLGLFYEVIVGLFAAMEFDEKYGAIVCATTPLNLIIAPFTPITFFPLSDSFLIWFNNILCHLVYLPINVIITLAFTVTNVILLPIAYVTHLLALI